VTLNIHNDSEQQRSLINDSVRCNMNRSYTKSNTFDNIATNLGATSRRFAAHVTNFVQSHKMMLIIIGAFVGVWALWFLLF